MRLIRGSGIKGLSSSRQSYRHERSGISIIRPLLSYSKKSLIKCLALKKQSYILDPTNKDFRLQPRVAKNIVNQVKKGNESIMGLMLESNINEGNQKITENLDELKYGVSLTDACINWETTNDLLMNLRSTLITK